MDEFTAEIECGFINFQIEATIDPDVGVCIRMVLMDGKPLLIDQEIYFEERYGEDELKAEVMTQYRREADWEIERGAA